MPERESNGDSTEIPPLQNEIGYYTELLEPLIAELLGTDAENALINFSQDIQALRISDNISDLLIDFASNWGDNDNIIHNDIIVRMINLWRVASRENMSWLHYVINPNIRLLHSERNEEGNYNLIDLDEFTNILSPVDPHYDVYSSCDSQPSVYSRSELSQASLLGYYTSDDQDPSYFTENGYDSPIGNIFATDIFS